MVKLFEVFPQHREETAIWKLTQHPVFWDFAGGLPVKWVAINIPMDAFGKNGFEGDVDLIFSIASPPISGFPPDYVRVFEIKTATINGKGNIKSLDNDKFEYGLKQCQKLEKFGAEMIFLIDILILEQGMATENKETWETITKKIDERTKTVKKTNYGYNVKFLQYLKDSDEYDTGKLFPSRDYEVGKFLKIKKPFKIFTEKLDNIAKNISENQEISILFFCKKCRKIANTSTQNRNIVCSHCGFEIKVHD